MPPENILILGATGSIGEQTIRIIRKWPERFHLAGFSYHHNFEKAKEIQKEFSVKCIACSDPEISESHKKHWRDLQVTLFLDLNDLLEVGYDKLLTAVVGASGVNATYKATRQGKTILIANKESLVMAGRIVMESAIKNGTKIVPVDSEHNSLFRLIKNQDKSMVQKMYLTASGGPFHNLTRDEILTVQKAQVLRHPNWDMGAKISVDSAGMINKALEVIEACHLFQLGLEEIDAVIHPQSYIHAIIKYKDGSYFFHGCEPNMLLPLSHGLFEPEEPPDWVPHNTNETFPDLTFSKIDLNKYPGYRLGIQSAEKGDAYPAIFNAANEEAVFAFLEDKIQFYQIPYFIEDALNQNHPVTKPEKLDDLFEADEWARNFVRKQVG